MRKIREVHPVTIICLFWAAAIVLVAGMALVGAHHQRQIATCIESGHAAVQHIDGSVQCIAADTLEATAWTR